MNSAELNGLLIIVVGGLLLINLLLTMKLLKAVQLLKSQVKAEEPLPQGAVIPTILGNWLQTGETCDSKIFASEPQVFIFLATICPKCQEKLTEVKELWFKSRGQGVSIWLLSDEEPSRVKEFLNSSPLVERTLIIDKDLAKQINPLEASPYYLFVDENSVLQAQGFIGDENWLSFCEQVYSSDSNQPVTT